MATLALPYTFVNGTTADADEVNSNFTVLKDFVNEEPIQTDGSNAMSANLDVGSNKIVNVTAGTADGDAVNVAQLDANKTVGEVSMYSGASAPTGWLICDGSAVSRTTYSDLFTVVSTTYGVGDGATTFNLPDLQGNFVIGKSGSYALAATGGSKDAVAVNHGHSDTFSVASSGSHGHSDSFAIGTTGSTHTHGVSVAGGSLYDLEAIAIAGGFPTTGGGTPGYMWNAVNGTGRLPNSSSLWDNGALTVTTTTASSTHTHNITGSVTTGGEHAHTVSGSVTSLTGEDGTDANLPPYLALNFIIRT